MKAVSFGIDQALILQSELQLQLSQISGIDENLLQKLDFVKEILQGVVQVNKYTSSLLDKVMCTKRCASESVQVTELLGPSLDTVRLLYANTTFNLLSPTDIINKHIVVNVEAVRECALILLSNAATRSSEGEVNIRPFLTNARTLQGDTSTVPAPSPHRNTDNRVFPSAEADDSLLLCVECEASGEQVTEHAVQELFHQQGLNLVLQRTTALGGYCGGGLRRDGRPGCRLWFAIPFIPAAPTLSEVAEPILMQCTKSRSLSSDADPTDRITLFRHNIASDMEKHQQLRTALTYILPHSQQQQLSTDLEAPCRISPVFDSVTADRFSTSDLFPNFTRKMSRQSLLSAIHTLSTDAPISRSLSSGSGGSVREKQASAIGKLRSVPNFTCYSDDSSAQESERLSAKSAPVPFTHATSTAPAPAAASIAAITSVPGAAMISPSRSSSSSCSSSDTSAFTARSVAPRPVGHCSGSSESSHSSNSSSSSTVQIARGLGIQQVAPPAPSDSATQEVSVRTPSVVHLAVAEEGK